MDAMGRYFQELQAAKRRMMQEEGLEDREIRKAVA
jgi:hypothetical protein